MSIEWFKQVAVHGDGKEQASILSATFVEPVSDEVSEELFERMYPDRDIEHVVQVKHVTQEIRQKIASVRSDECYVSKTEGRRAVNDMCAFFMTYGSANGTRWNTRLILQIFGRGAFFQPWMNQTLVTFVDVTIFKTDGTEYFPINGTPLMIHSGAVMRALTSWECIADPPPILTEETKELKEFKQRFEELAISDVDDVKERLNQIEDDLPITNWSDYSGEILAEKYSLTEADVYHLADTIVPYEAQTDGFNDRFRPEVPLPIYEKATGKPVKGFECWIVCSRKLDGCYWSVRISVFIGREGEKVDRYTRTKPVFVTYFDALLARHGIKSYDIVSTPFTVPWADLMATLLNYGFFNGSEPDEIEELVQRLDHIGYTSYLKSRRQRAIQREKANKKRKQPSVLSDKERQHHSSSADFGLQPPPAARHRDAEQQ